MLLLVSRLSMDPESQKRGVLDPNWDRRRLRRRRVNSPGTIDAESNRKTRPTLSLIERYDRR
jgi:hypothetical protein